MLQVGLGLVDILPNRPGQNGYARDITSTTSSGYGLAPAAGYEWWIGDELSAGVLARVTVLHASTWSHESNILQEEHTIFSPSLLATIVYH
ncbi:MAG: hypothetical protein IT374_03280 [Polyangiaceae bacterium]|nr:hypothetical protein [Polyangiaceae bacterium]